MPSGNPATRPVPQFLFTRLDARCLVNSSGRGRDVGRGIVDHGSDFQPGTAPMGTVVDGSRSSCDPAMSTSWAERRGIVQPLPVSRAVRRVEHVLEQLVRIVPTLAGKELLGQRSGFTVYFQSESDLGRLAIAVAKGW